MLPPLSALLAFEAVARLLSFTRAAEELHVTPGAVSQQVRALEQHMGEALFDRTRRSVSLTSTARRVLPDVRSGLQLLVRAASWKPAASHGRTLTISVAPSFASKWLLPRLGPFYDRHPDIDLRISATVALTNFGDGGGDAPDLAIRFGHGEYAGLQSEKLFSEWITPLCSPRLPTRSRPLKRAEDLRRFRLLHDASVPGEDQSDDWQRWLTLAGARNVPTISGMRFTLAEHALQAAIDGAGVVLGRLGLADRDLAAGRLVRPFELALPLKVGYFLVTPNRRRERAEIQCFREWLLETVGQSASAHSASARRERKR